MLRRLLTPVHTLDLTALRLAGAFRSPEGESGDAGGDKSADKGAADGGKGSEGDKGGKDGEGDKGKPADTAGRIGALVEERNAAQRLADEQKATAERLQRELDQLKANDQSKVVTDLQKQIADAQAATKTRFDKLLEAELANLPGTAAAAVKAIPGGSEVQFDWLIANRGLFQSAEGGGKSEEETKGVPGPKNDKKPPKGDESGASSVAKGYVESRKPQKSGFPGLTG